MESDEDELSCHIHDASGDYAYFTAPSNDRDSGFRLTLHIDGQACTGLLDTGATRTIISEDVVVATRAADRVLKAYDGGVVKTLGMADIVVSTGNCSTACTCFVVPSGQTSLFGQDIIRQLDLLDMARVVHTCPVDITVDPDAQLVALPPRRHAFTLREATEKEIQRLEGSDIIERVKEATPWVSPLVPVKKANGNIRLCVDYRRVNKSIIRERHMLPTAEEIIAQLDGATVFSLLDAESGFHQLPLSEKSKPLTTFTSH